MTSISFLWAVWMGAYLTPLIEQGIKFNYDQDWIKEVFELNTNYSIEIIMLLFSLTFISLLSFNIEESMTNASRNYKNIIYSITFSKIVIITALLSSIWIVTYLDIFLKLINDINIYNNEAALSPFVQDI